MATNNTYQWVAGSRLHKLDPTIAGEALKRLDQQYHGALTSDVLVTASQAPEAPLHDAFEWDDAKCGEQWRTSQAGHILRSIRVVRADVPEATPQRVYLNVDTPTESFPDQPRVYMRVERVQAEESLRHQILLRAKREMQAWIQRYQDIEELLPFTTAVLDELDVLATQTDQEASPPPGEDTTQLQSLPGRLRSESSGA